MLGPPSSLKADGSSTPCKLCSFGSSRIKIPCASSSAVSLRPWFGPDATYHSRYRIRHPRGKLLRCPPLLSFSLEGALVRISVSSPATAHHPTEDGEAEPQSIERKRYQSAGISNGGMT